ncbi:hypothetical protein [Fructilactobacillus florum]|uniref:Glutamate--cysteine ligase n=1 Tax=Fructilactobacillus florum DSM 22689 = JCM 16035 TaxID=1423745 RepID=A0A0R2CJJ5_9LACO|nr:hypothetical protein [Fructilactobacillus florum]KRM91823.1 gamma-glutamylcysteine synthetase [Fructilactobacillus florum DSM 22689 = JCM 16035]
MKTLTGLFEGHLGIEIEEHRVDLNTKTLSRAPHPQALGDRRSQPYFQTDFSESMEELITAPQDSVVGALANLRSLQAILQLNLQPQEIIWGLSMPPRLQESDVVFLKNTFHRDWYLKYRNWLLKHYGPFHHIICGVHVNYSPLDATIADFQQQHHLTSTVTAKNRLLFLIAQQIVGYRWLVTYFFGAAPVSENPADDLPKQLRSLAPVRSFRSSSYGFANRANVRASYANLTKFIADLQQLIATKQLAGMSEFYGPVRLKGAELADLQTKGIEYLEFRILDDDPFVATGVSAKSLYFLQFLVADALSQQHEWTVSELAAAEQKNEEVALQHPQQPLTTDQFQQTIRLLQRFEKLISSAPVKLQPDLISTLQWLQSALDHPHQTVSGRLLKKIEHGSLTAFALHQGQGYRKQFQTSPASTNFPQVPANLRQSYIKLHQVGLPMKLIEGGWLEVQLPSGKKTVLHSDADLNRLGY